MLKRRELLLIVLSLFAGAPLIFATDGTWTNIGGGNWSDANKWRSVTIADGPGSVAAISASIIANSYTVTMDSARSAGTLIFSDNAGQDNYWTLSDAGTGSRILTLTNTLAATPMIICSNRISYLDVTLAGSQGLLVESKNSLSAGNASYGLTFRRTNSYTGVTTLRKGELGVSVNAPLGAPGAFGPDTSAIQIGEVGVTLPTEVLGLRLDKLLTFERDLVVNNVGSNVTIGAIADTGAYTRSFKGAIKLNRSVSLSTGSNGKVLFEGLISGSGGVTLNNYGSVLSTLEFYNTNSYSGPTVISRGVINIYTNAPNGDNGALGNATTDVILGDTDTLNYLIALNLKPGTTFGRNLWVKDTGSSGAVTLGVISAAAATYSGNIRTDRRLSLNASGANGKPVFYTGVISGTGSVEVTAIGDVVLENTNTFSGDFYHNIAKCNLYFGRDVMSGQPSPLGNSTNPVYFSGVSSANSHYLYVTNTLTFERPIRVEEGALTQLGVASSNIFPVFSGPISYAANLALYSDDYGQLRVSGQLTTQTNSLTLNGSSKGCYIYLSNTNNQLNGAVSITAAARLVVEKSGALNGATQVVFAAGGTSTSPVGLFAGDDVTITQSVLQALSTYNGASGNFEIGTRVTNGSCVFAGPISITRTNTNPYMQFTAPSNALVRFIAPVSGFVFVRKADLGTVSFEAANSYTNDTEILQGALRAVSGQGLPSLSRLIFTDGVLESTGTFSRALGIGPGQVAWAGGSSTRGGFSAKGGKLTVDLNNDGPVPLAWASTPSFIGHTSARMRFGSSMADSEVDFIDPIQLVNNGNVEVYDNPAVRTDKATLSGALSGSGSFTKFSSGTLVLKATNTLTGGVTVSTDGGALLVNGELPSAATTLLVYSNGWLGGSGTIRTRTVTMNPGSGFDWADDPGTLTITNSFAFPTNGVFRFVYGSGKTSKVVSGNKLTLPQYATVELVQLNGPVPIPSILLSSANTVGDVTDWTIANNTAGYTLVKSGNDVILQSTPKGTLMIVK